MTMESYASLQDIIGAINTQKVDATQYGILLDNADSTSRRIDGLLASEVPYFLPYKESWDIPTDGMFINSQLGTLDLGRPLLELSGVTVNGQDYTSFATAYPATVAPIRKLRLTDRCHSWYDFCNLSCGDVPMISIDDGIWGYRRRGGVTWKQVGTLHASIDAVVTAIAVDSLDTMPVALSGETANLSAGHLLKIGTEFMVKSYTATGQTVERAVNGTTAAAHTALDLVYVFQVEEPIRRVTAREAGLMLARRGAYDIRGSNEVGTSIAYPQDLLNELYGAVNFYAK